jgi:hypothetical protein
MTSPATVTSDFNLAKGESDGRKKDAMDCFFKPERRDRRNQTGTNKLG